MNKKINSSYETAANVFTAFDIAQPLKMFLPDESLISVWEEFMTQYPIEWFSLVRDSRHTYGYLAFDDEAFQSWPIKGLAREEASHVEPEIVVPASLPLLELIPLFQESYFFFLLSRNEITHYVSFSDLDKLPFKFCLFGLFMELESQLVELLSIDNSKTKQYLSLLTKERLKKAEDLCTQKYKKETPYHLLLCTTFVDKKEMFMKSLDFKKDELPFESKNKTNRFFRKIEDVRNQIAHSDSILQKLRTPSELNVFINDLSNLTNTIANMKDKALI